MARIYGKSAEYLVKGAGDRSLRILMAGMLTVFLLGLAGGYTSALFSKAQAWFGWAGVMGVLAFGVSMLAVRWFNARVLVWEKARLDFRRGARGEAVVAEILSRLGDSYFVMHNIPTSYADYDHIVVGPTGVFVIETKDWRGLVAPDGLGEILLNGKPTPKPVIRNFIAHVMRLRNHVCEAVGSEHFFQPVFVFTSALVKAKPGETRNARCIPEENLLETIEEAKPARRLPPADTLRITKALYAFAQMNGKPPHCPETGEGKALAAAGASTGVA